MSFSLTPPNLVVSQTRGYAPEFAARQEPLTPVSGFCVNIKGWWLPTDDAHLLPL